MNRNHPAIRYACLVAVLACMLPYSLKAWPRIKIKKPRITVGKPKVSIPSPNTVIKNVTAAVADAHNDVTKAVGVAINQTGKAAGKGAHDLVMETGRIPGHLVEVGDALVAYTNSLKNSAVNGLSDAQRRVREGKLVDAFLHLAVAPLKAEEEAAFAATQKSGWVNSAGAIAASAYGGPAGAAAYAAWQTYRLTGNNAELAIRAGVIAGLTSMASEAVSKMPAEAYKKAILGGAIGGLSIAASGGDDKAIQNSIIMGGAMVLIQDAYQSYLGHELDAKAATEPPYCMCPTDPSCEELKKAFTYNEDTKQLEFDPSKLKANKSHVGIQTEVISTSGQPVPITSDVTWGSDRSLLNQGVAKVPGMNAMALFHDKWAFDWKMGSVLTKATIIPAVVITYIGAGAPVYTAIPENLAKENDTDNKNTPVVPVVNDTVITENSTAENGQSTVLAALQAYQASLPDTGYVSLGSPLLKTLRSYQKTLDKRSDSIVSAHKNRLLKLAGDIVEPVPGWEWDNPQDTVHFAVHKIKGVEVDKDGKLYPAAGWQWADDTDALSVAVKPIEGIVVTQSGELEPAEGWEWKDPKNPKNIEVIKSKPETGTK